VRFVLASGIEVEVPEGIVRTIVTTRLAPNPYWGYQPWISRGEVKEFLEFLKGDREIDRELKVRMAWYFLFYAENVTLAGYLQALGHAGSEEARAYLEFNKPVLERLREFLRKAGGAGREEFLEILDLLVEYGLDPL